MITKPRIPDQYILDAPIFLISREIGPEDFQTLLALWACACQAIQEGAEPIWLLSDVIRLLAEKLEIHRSVAYRRVKRLLAMRWQGKRLLVLTGPTEHRGPNLLTLGEAFEADLARIRWRVASAMETDVAAPEEDPSGEAGRLSGPEPPSAAAGDDL